MPRARRRGTRGSGHGPRPEEFHPRSLHLSRSCEEKRSFRNKERALLGAQRASERWGKPLRAYECPLCGRWHLTTRGAPVTEDERRSAVTFQYLARQLSQVKGIRGLAMWQRVDDRLDMVAWDWL